MKRKLIIAIAALVCSIGSWAQIDVTSKYLTNPSFETGDMTGWQYLWDNHDHTSIPFAAYGTGSSEYTAFSSGGGTAAKGNYIAKMGSVNWCDKYIVYQSSSVTLPAGTYKLSANLQSNANLGSYELGIVEGSVSSESKDVTFMESTSGSFAEALKGTTIEKQFTIASSTEVTFAAKSSMWGENHEFYLDDFKLYRLTDVTSLIDNADFEGDYTTPYHPNGDRDISQPNGWTLTYENGATYDSSILKETQATYSNISSTVTIPADGRGAQTYAVRFHNNNNNQLITLSQSKVLPRGRYTISGSFRTNNQNELEVGLYRTSYSNENRKKFEGGNSSWGTLSTNTFDSDGKTATVIGVFFKHTAKQQNVAGVDNITLSFQPLADSDDYAELNAAIATVEAYTLGFDVGEYAAYNVLPALNAAKAIDQKNNNLYTTVRDAIDALNAITANVLEVNAIYWKTDYTTDDKAADGYVHPLGWTNTGYNTRFLNKDLSNETALKTIDHCIMSKFNTSYGTNNDYKMPLKANTFYTLTFRYCGWGNNPETRVVVKDASSTSLTLRPSNSFTPETSDGNSNAAHWYDYSVTFRTNAAGNYTLELNKVPSGQQQIAWTNMRLVRATEASEVKYFLNAEITDANAIYASGANAGDGAFQIPTAAGNTFNTAINTTAQGVYENDGATISDVVAAIDNLKTAEETYNNTALNTPPAGVQYRIKSTAADAADWKNLYYVLKKDAGQAHGGYSTRAEVSTTDAFYATAWEFVALSGNQYKLRMTDADGAVRYLCTNIKGYDDGSATQIRTITDADKALVVKVIAATGTAGRWYLQNTENDSYLGGQDAGLFSNSQNYDLAIEAASKAEVSVNIASGKYGTRIFPFTPSAIDGVTYYSCDAADGSTLTLVEEDTPTANKPYILLASKDVDETLSDYGTASATSYEAGYLTGVYTLTEVPSNSYVLQTLNGKQAFYLVDNAGKEEEQKVKAPAYRAYLTVSGGAVKAFFFNEETPTAINAIEAAQAENAEIYNLAGQRLNKAQKGVNIINGKKVLVK